MSPIKRPSFLRIDALKELGNIGSAHAVTGLSELLRKRVDVAITSVDIIPLNIIYNLFNGPESMVSVVYIEGYSDDLRGMIFKDEYSLSTLREIGNIMCGCYLNSLSSYINRKLMHSVPQISHDMLGAVMDSVLIDLSLENDYAFVLETAFTLTDGWCKGFLFFVPTSDSLSVIFNEIGVE
jgi:chemotaxis protein CheC